jgi:hypothetical protein
VLLAILYESHAWRQTVWHVVDQALVVESKVRALQECCAPRKSQAKRVATQANQYRSCAGLA